MSGGRWDGKDGEEGVRTEGERLRDPRFVRSWHRPCSLQRRRAWMHGVFYYGALREWPDRQERDASAFPEPWMNVEWVWGMRAIFCN